MTSTRPARRRTKRALAGIAVAVLASVTALVNFSPGTQPAVAGWAGNSGGTGCTAVNMSGYSGLGFYYNALSSTMTTTEDWVRTNDINPTDISTYTSGSLTSVVDVVVQDSTYISYCGYDWWTAADGGVTGVTVCNTTLGNGKCQQHTIRYQTPYVNAASTAQRRGLACHESGHALGLTHSTSDTSCMKPNDSTPAQNYNSTDIGYLNANY